MKMEHGGAVVSTAVSQQEGRRTPTWARVKFCMFSACVGFLQVLWLPPTVQRHSHQPNWRL